MVDIDMVGGAGAGGSDRIGGNDERYGFPPQRKIRLPAKIQ